MRYIWQHIEAIIGTYNGSLPLTHFLKQYCKRYPQLGSRDRRILNEMAYCWYRCSKGIGDGSFEEKMKVCLAVCGNEAIQKRFLTPAESKPQLAKGQLFPHHFSLSAGIDKNEWLGSMLVQPSLFIRIRKDKASVEALLNDKDIPYSYISDNCMALSNGAAIDGVLPADTYAVQDASSQRTGDHFRPEKGQHWYDCCSGAGGKSLLLKDLQPSVKLAVSDIRDTILHNLRERFRNYGHQAPVTYCTDVADSKALAATLQGAHFDNIICDAPCTGSGTWARTPEQMYFFQPASIAKFTSLQAAIATNVAAYLKPGGRLIYITCSVFDAENNGVVDRIIENTGLELIGSGLMNGAAIRADSMYVAELQKM